ncbi:MAG TPA: hypothetical protein VMW73_13695 [Spirochaetia bacterium]|nr:hypothetical protein [Spirochaetia bacterium]
MRSVDIIGWLNDDWIGVVLPSTPHKGAEQFAQRIDATDHHKTPPNQIINTYPEHWQLENSERRAAMQAPADSSRKRVGIFLWIVAIIVAGAGFSACGNIAVSQTDSEAGVTVTFGASTYGAPELGFASSDVSISKGQVLNVSTSNPELRDLPNWSWYVNNVRDDTQSSATFSWDTTVCSPGQYIISAAVVYADLRLSGSFRVTVRDIGGV